MQENTENGNYPEIPGYRIISELGRGGIATVYLAIQESLDRQVALKVMSPMLAAEQEYAERFIREGRTVAQLSHPNIITVYDIGLQKHQLFIAMEYISGGNMRSKMQQHANDPEWALGVAGQIAIALGYAHKVGIVHRDVKPENILFRENGAAVLTDFGIAKTITSNTNLTQAGTIIGTPKYMSPEQTDGLGNDPRTDIYSLGIILYEMLTGNVPYDSDNSMAVLYAHVHSPVPELPNELSDLQPLMNNMLAKNVEERADDAEALAEIIRITRRERHYALKDPSRMGERLQPVDEAFLDTVPMASTGKTSSAANRLPGKISEWVGKFAGTQNPGGRNLVIITSLIIAVVLVYLLTLGNGDTGTGEEVTTGNPEKLEDTETTPPSGDVQRDSSITSLPGDRPRSITSNNDGSAVAGTTDKTAEAEDIAPPLNPTLEKEKENRSQELISRFLADESNDELVREQKAAAEARKTAIAMSEQRQVRESAREANIHRLLGEARTAVEENRILTPDGDNAISLYQRVLDISPNNKRAIRGLDVSADLLYEQAKQLYFDGQPDAALREINVALETLPGNEKLQQLKVSIESSFNPNSSYAKAEKLYYGVDGPKNRSRAAFYYRIAAERGHALAMNAIGVAYADGDGVPANDSEAIRWLKASAEKGNSEAMYNLALGYLFSAKENEEIAFSWVKKAADDKYRPAYALISWMSTTGTGTKANRFSSFGWELKGMFNPISEELHDQYRIPRGWQKKFAAAYKKSTIALP